VLVISGSVHKTPQFSWVTDNALIVNYPDKILSSDFAYWLLYSTDLRVDTSSSAQPVISGAKIYSIKLSLPPIEEQTEIVRLVEQYFALADTLEKHLQNAKQRVDNLTQAILAKAFKGELVAQDPSDEPAEQLLARIKAAREQAETLEKAAKKVAKVKSNKK